jgi:hypothetical protein
MTVAQRQNCAAQLEELLCNKLWQFRLGLEAQAGQSIIELDAPVALVLSDLCVFLGLSEEQHARVLGQEGVAYTNEVLETRVRVATSGHRPAARR